MKVTFISNYINHHQIPLSDELYHHGVKDMKWGVRNGPPYPLDSDISTGERLKVHSDTVKYGRYPKNATTDNPKKLLATPTTPESQEKLKQRVLITPQNKKLKTFSQAS